MAIEVIKSGMLATIQDLGRIGYQRFGVNCNGALDESSARVANILVGNDEHEAVIELTLFGTALKFTSTHLIAICGGDMNPYVNNQPVDMWQPIIVTKDSTLSFAQYRAGCRVYIAIAGGLAIEKVLGSYSTSLRAKMGGFAGRALKAGDIIPTNKVSSTSLSHRLWKKVEQEQGVSYHVQHFAPAYADVMTIRFIRGQDFHHLTEQSKQHWTSSVWTIDAQSDRMGYKLMGESLQWDIQEEKISAGVVHGTVQLPANGQPIVLLADRQTIGGYPQIAIIAAKDLSVFGQLKPGQKIKFVEITLEEAEQLYINYEQEIAILKTAIRLKTK